MHIKLKRPAIAMIELIFAIVIMGIVMMSAPMLIETSAKSTSVALQQEGINEAASRIGMIMTHEWDENNNVPCMTILGVSSSGDIELNKVDPTEHHRIGVPIESRAHSFICGSFEANASAIGIEGTEKDDIDDFKDTTISEVSIGTGGINYIEQTTVSIATSVYYTTDAADYNSTSFAYNFTPGSTTGNNSTNIKALKVRVTSTSGVDELDKDITLNAFSCNTGPSWEKFELRVIQ